MAFSIPKIRIFIFAGSFSALMLGACTLEQTPATDAAEESDIPSPAAVQETEMEDFISMTEFFTVKVPEGWSATELVPGSAIVMANSQAALDRYGSGSAIESDDLVLNVGFLPYALLQQPELRPLNIQFEASPEVFLESLMPMFRTADDLTFGEAEIVSLSDDREAGMLTVSNEQSEGKILTFAVGEGVVAVVSTVAFPGEIRNFDEITYAIAADVSFSGAQDALYGALLGG